MSRIMMISTLVTSRQIGINGEERVLTTIFLCLCLFVSKLLAGNLTNLELIRVMFPFKLLCLRQVFWKDFAHVAIMLPILDIFVQDHVLIPKFGEVLRFAG